MITMQCNAATHLIVQSVGCILETAPSASAQDQWSQSHKVPEWNISYDDQVTSWESSQDKKGLIINFFIINNIFWGGLKVMAGLALFIACYKVGFWRVFAWDLIKNHPRTQDNDYTLPDSKEVRSQQAVIGWCLISVSHPDSDGHCQATQCIPMQDVSESLTGLIRHVFCH